jgi:hypothetical protein
MSMNENMQENHYYMLKCLVILLRNMAHADTCLRVQVYVNGLFVFESSSFRFKLVSNS